MKPGAALVAIAALVVAIPPARAWIEGDMASHMLVQFPLLCAAGAAAAGGLRPATRRRLDAWNRHGLTGLLLFTLTVAYWMIPAALDQALLDPRVGAAKYLSLVAAGFALRLSLASAPVPVQAFFVGNTVWMMATAGLLYIEAPAQICLSYLQPAQQPAGAGLVVFAVTLGLAWLHRAIGPPRAGC